MEAIFSSKLYKTSKRKDRIASAMKNPINTELVQQLEDYLGDSDLEKQSADQPLKVQPENTVELKDTEEKVSDAASESSGGTSYHPALRFSPSSTPSSEPTSEESADRVDDTSTPEVKEVTHVEDAEPDVDIPAERDAQSTFHAPKKKDEASVEESETINAATALYQPPVEASCCDKIRVDAAAIKGTLNVRDDTNGVSRVFVKDNELWIYYQDKINLNSVMEPVIEVLNGTGFTNLEFNRLARTDNAIVFEISCVYEDVKPMNEVTEKK